MGFTDESRILEMQFDGRDFDKNIRKSQKSLEDFKKSLNFEDAAKQMEPMMSAGEETNRLLRSMSENVSKLSNVFTGVGNVGTFIAQKIKHAWEGAINSMERFGKSLTSDQISEGHKKYDKLLKSVQTIMNATGDSEEFVYGVMEQLNKYTDETSYNFSDMASNIGKFTTAGVKLEDAEAEMEGIANWAALAGQGVNEASRAMYNISQAMSAGYMQKIDYKSIQNANMDIRAFREEAIKAAVAVGTLQEKNGKFFTKKGNKEVNLDNFAETLQFKWFDKKTMETVFKTFSDNSEGIGEKAYKAAQRCTTFSDALNAIKDMLSTGWMKTYEHIFGKLSDAMALFSGMCNKATDMLKKFVDMRNGILERWSLGGGRDSLWGALVGSIESPDGDQLFKGAYGLLDVLNDVSQTLYDAFWSFVRRFVSSEGLDDFDNDEGVRFAHISASLHVMGDQIKDFTAKVRSFLHDVPAGETESRMDKLRHIAEGVFAVIKFIGDIIKGVISFGMQLTSQLSPAFTTVLSLFSYLSELFSGSVAKGAKKNAVGNFFTTLATILRPVTDLITLVVGAVAKFIAQFVTFAHQSGLISLIGTAIQWVASQIANLANKITGSGIFQTVSGWMQKLIAKIPSLIDKIKTFFTTVKENIQNSKLYSGFLGMLTKIFGGKTFGDVWKNIKSGFKGLIKKIPSLLSTALGALGSVFGGLGTFFDDTLGNVMDLLFGKDEGLNGKDKLGKQNKDASKGEAITDAIAEAVTPGNGAAAKSLLTRVKEALQGIWQPIKDFLSNFVNVTLPEFWNSDFANGIKNFFSGTKFKDLLINVPKLIKAIGFLRAGSGIAGIGKGIKGVGKGFQLFGQGFALFGKNMKNMKDFGKNFGKSFKPLSEGSGFDFGELGNQLLKIASSIGIVTLALTMIAKIKTEDLLKGGLAIVSIIGIMVGAEFLARKIGSGGKGLLALSLAVTMMLIPMNMISKMDGTSLLTQAIKLLGFVTALALVSKLCGEVKSTGFIKLAAAVILFMIPLKQMANMEWVELGKGIGGLAGLFAVLAGMSFVMKKISNVNGVNGAIGLALSLTQLIGPIKDLGKMSGKDILKGIGGLTGIVVGIIALLAMSKKCDASKVKEVRNVLLAFAVMAFVVTNGVSKLADQKVDWKLVAAVMAGIIGMVVAIGVILPLLSKLDVKGALIAIVALTVAVAAIMGVVTLMAPMLLGSIGRAMSQMAAQLRLMSGLLKDFFEQMDAISEESAKHAEVIFDKLKNIVLKFADFNKYEAGVRSASSLLGSLGNGVALFFYGDGKLPDPDSSKTIKTLNKIIEIAPSLSTINVGDLPKQLMYLGTGIMLYNEATKDITNSEPPSLAQLKNIGAAATEVIGKIDNSIAENLMYLGIGLMLFNEATADVTNSDPPALSLLRGLFGEAGNIEAFTKLPLTELSSKMSTLGGAMSLYAKGASEVTGLETTDGAPDVSGAVEILKKVGASISGEDGSGEFKIPENMPSTDDLGTFAGQLEALGKALTTYADAASKLTGEGPKRGEELIKLLASLGTYLTPANLKTTSAFKDAGISSEGKTGDDTVLGRFAVDVAALGVALGEFAKLPDKDSFSGGIDAVSKLADINSKLTSWNLAFLNSFNKAEVHGGEGSVMGQFAIDIGALGGALASFAELPAYDKFSGGITALEHLADINSKLTFSNLGFLNVFNTKNMHETELGQFATDIGALGGALATFAENVTMEDGTQADFDYAVRALNFMATIRNRLPQVGGIKQWWEGNREDFGSLSTGITQIGEALKTFSDKLTAVGTEGKAFDYAASVQGLEAIRQMIGLMNELNMVYTHIQVDQRAETQYGLMSSRTQLEEAEAYLTSVGKRLTHLANFMTALSQDFSRSGLVMDLGADQGTILDRMAAFAKKVSEVFTSGDIRMDAINNFKNIASALSDLNAIDPSLDFHYPGEMISKGIAEGIRNGESEVVQAIIDVVQAGIDAGNDTADVHSPSRVFAEMGRYMDLGLAKGLRDNTGTVEGASGDMVNNLIDRSTSLMALISQAMADSIDLQPTITPVLDLSQLTAAGSTIDSLFAGYGLSASNALARAAASAGREGPAEVYVQNPTDLSGIQGAINSLQTQLDALGESIRNMKIVLSTGVVAGGVTDDVDLNLGRKILYASRRN